MLLHAIECLCKPHKHFRRLRPGGGAARLQGAVIVAVDKGIAVGPGHGGKGPLLHGIPVGELRKVALSSQIGALVRDVVVQHLCELFTADGLIRAERAVLVAIHHAGGFRPGDGGLVPVIHQVGEVGSPTPLRLALQVVEDLHGLGPSQALAGHEGGGAGALHTLRFCCTPTARAKALPFSPILRYTKPSKTIAR